MVKDLRCQCGHKLAEYTDTEVRIMDKKCKSVTTLIVVDGKLQEQNKDYLVVRNGIQFTKNIGKKKIKLINFEYDVNYK